MVTMIDVRVELGDRSYEVVVGRGARSRVRAMLPAGVRRVAVVTQEGIPSALVPDLDEVIVSTHVIGQGESHKSLATIERLCSEFVRAGLTRSDAVVAVGGGMVTDVAGFAAASYHRGVPVVHVATSLLAMIDAAVGGKTGVNIAEGKNLVGAFWQPHGVACDLDALDSLPEAEMRSGQGEMAKYHFISGQDLSDLPFEERVARCVEIKARIVAADEREGGMRALLNYGHTLAHALEIGTDFAIAHGEAVSIGVLYAAHLARRMDRIDDGRVEDHYRVVHDVYGLRNQVPAGVDADTLVRDMRRDKKAIDSLTFILDSARGLEVVPGVEESAVRDAFGDLLARVG